MHFLNGRRIYINPESGCATLEEQLLSCITKLGEINSGKKLFKVNFFVDSGSGENCEALNGLATLHIKNIVAEPVILTFISQPPLTCRIIAEAFYYNPDEWLAEYISKENGEAYIFTKDETCFLDGRVISEKGTSRGQQADEAFRILKEIMDAGNFETQTLIRQWNYIEDILDKEKGKQNYQEFNDSRSRFYGQAFNSTGYPAATGIGMKRGGVLIEFIALKSDTAKSVVINNPLQVNAHQYSPDVLIGDETCKTTPKFERARFLELFGQKGFFISGTASIVGEKTVGLKSPTEQTKVTIQNIRQLYSEKILNNLGIESTPQYGHARVYVKNRKDFHAIRRVFKLYYGDLPVVYIIADICRDELLVEIEGEVILH